jgi:hypothetical protein
MMSSEFRLRVTERVQVLIGRGMKAKKVLFPML